MSSTADYREHYRQQHIPSGYSGGLHLTFILVFTLGGIILAGRQLQDVGPLEWATLPLAFLYANLVEYAGHRWVMHRRIKGLGLVYHRHAKQHHRFFTISAMAMDDTLDYRAILFPPLLMLFFFGAFAFPLGLMLTSLFSPNVACLFLIMALAYYLNYELLHLVYHLPEDSGWLQLPLLRRLRALHHEHHDPRIMAHKNFNITYPIFDWLLNTRA